MCAAPLALHHRSTSRARSSLLPLSLVARMFACESVSRFSRTIASSASFFIALFAADSPCWCCTWRERSDEMITIAACEYPTEYRGLESASLAASASFVAAATSASRRADLRRSASACPATTTATSGDALRRSSAAWSAPRVSCSCSRSEAACFLSSASAGESLSNLACAAARICFCSRRFFICGGGGEGWDPPRGRPSRRAGSSAHPPSRPPHR